ncbi:MAG TPA: CBS domain-containing protein [Candidatus Borkfalkia excrementigallinarum]|uniref:CBS domain-containing protein n=1 Tax=Candidatus Borkfalkia excrementigallinarum TaxID=2838506 RepID=A0A9D2A0X6_9FIRM|nr:CBS domain-containing protein [Candidatus Borkfalkia excrementigallinarum]
MDTRNATEFIASYNKIDAQLRELYGFKPSQPFTDVVRRSAEKNAIVRRYENELADYARLRNAIVHQSTDGRIIAVPCDDVVESIQLIERLLCSPPTVGETLQDKRIVSIEAEISLKQAVMLMARTGYSNIPVYRGKRMIGIANNRRILRELGGVLARGLSADAWLGGTAVSDILSESDLFVYYKYIGKKDSLQEIVDAFEENRKLLAVCVSENGRAGERVVNFITAADLPHLNKLLEDYK